MAGSDDLADRLGSELKRSFLYLKQFWEQDVSQVLLCGDMPEIRSLTAPLIERLNIEVETLDSLDGIDTAELPEPSEQFSDQVASLRLAAAIAAEPPPVNLLPVEITAERASRTGRFVFAAGAAAAVAVGAFFYAQEGARQDNALRAAVSLQQQTTALQPRLHGASLVTSNGPGAQIARILEDAAQSTAREDTVRRIHIAADPAGWRVSILRARPSGAETSVGLFGAEMSATKINRALLRTIPALSVVAPLVIFGFIYVLAISPARQAAARRRVEAEAARAALVRTRAQLRNVPVPIACAAHLRRADRQRLGRRGQNRR